MGIIRDSFVMFKNWSEAIEALPDEYQLECYKAVAKYGLTGEIPEDISPVSKAMLISFSVGMENNITRYNASVENGKKGGRPKKETKETEENLTEQNKTQQNLEKPTKTQENLTEQTQNLNVNVNDNVNDIKLVKNNLNNKINVFNTYACVREIEPKTKSERQPFLDYYKEFFDWCYSDDFRKVAYEIIDTMIEAKNQASSEKGLTFNSVHYDEKMFIELLTRVDVEKFRTIVTQIKFNTKIKSRPHYILGSIIQSSNSETKQVMDKIDVDNFTEKI